MKILIKPILLIAIALILCTIADAQTTEPPTVTILQTTADKCARCFAESSAKDDVISTQAAQIKAKDDLNATREAIIEQQKTIIANDEKLISIYKAKSERKISFLFGLVKIRL